MGTCASSHATKRSAAGGGSMAAASAKVVEVDGRLQEFRRRITASEVLSGHPNCYLCSSDSMAINSTAPHLPKDHLLQPGQIYFLMPLSKSLSPLSLPDFCALAIKATTALNNNSAPFFHECTRLGLPA